MLHLSEFVRTLRSSVLVVFNNFLLIDATDRSKIGSDQKRLFIALSLYPLFFANTLFKVKSNKKKEKSCLIMSNQFSKLLKIFSPATDPNPRGIISTKTS